MHKFQKVLGETPLQAIERFRQENKQYLHSKIAYAGRLDPMAEGTLLLLIDEECKERDKFQNLDKVYEFELLLGLSTDTHDVLGIAQESGKVDQVTEIEIERILKKFTGKLKQQYPAFSSMTVEGKPLWKWYRDGRIDEITIPTKEIEIYKLEFLDKKHLPFAKVLEIVQNRVELVTGDFRQSEILSSWNSLNINGELLILKFRAEVSSGTYIRSLCTEIGKHLGSDGIAWSIKRTKFLNL